MSDRITYAVRQDSRRTGYCYYEGYIIGGRSFARGNSYRPKKSSYGWTADIKNAEFMSKEQALKIVNSLRYNNPTILELLIIDGKIEASDIINTKQ